MTNELEQKLKESKELFGDFMNTQIFMINNQKDAKEEIITYIEMGKGIKALYLQNEVIINYLQNIYKNQSEVKK